MAGTVSYTHLDVYKRQNVLRTLQLAARSLAPFFDQYDVLLTPTLATPPAVISSLQPSAGESRLLRIVNRLNAGWLLHALGVLRSVADKTFDYVPFTPLFNATGCLLYTSRCV